MRACRRCRLIEEDKLVEQCQNEDCKSHDLSVDFSGIVIVTNHEKSEIAQRMGVDKNGKYAIKVR